MQAPSSVVVVVLSSFLPPLIFGGGSLFTAMAVWRSQAEQDVVDERDRQGDEHSKNDSAIREHRKGFCVSGDWRRESLNRSWCSWFLSVLASCSPTQGEARGEGCTYAVLRMSGCTLYSFAKTKGTMPWGRAACSFRHFAKHRKHTVSKKGELLCWPKAASTRGGPGKETAQAQR